jgi:trigger factor
MRAEIETNLRREVKNRLKNRVKSQVMDALLKANPIETPRTLIEAEIDQLLQNARQNMEQRSGKKLKDFPIQREWFASQAKRRVNLGLLLSEIVKVNGLRAKPEQIRLVVEDAAQSYEHPEEIVRWYYAQPQRLAEIEGMVIEDNVVEWVLSNTKVLDKPITFDELMSQRD